MQSKSVKQIQAGWTKTTKKSETLRSLHCHTATPGGLVRNAPRQPQDGARLQFHMYRAMFSTNPTLDTQLPAAVHGVMDQMLGFQRMVPKLPDRFEAFYSTAHHWQPGQSGHVKIKQTFKLRTSQQAHLPDNGIGLPKQ